MNGEATSYVGLFSDDGAPSSVGAVRIPLFQRDYAQGRTDPASESIRIEFVRVLKNALTGGEPIGLDFVYGGVTNGVFEPLDGQQRLTTLFLLHVYLAHRCADLDPEAAWTRFTYETRPSARTFCERIVKEPPPADCIDPVGWLRDQPWFLHTWQHDPTIQGMLVTLATIHVQFAEIDPQIAWDRLCDRAVAPITFQVLPIQDLGPAPELYLKMNSRGKPLTPFENFKARFEKVLAPTGRATEFAHRVDGAWSDLLWPIHGGDNIVDDEFMHYLTFVVEVCEWRSGRAPEGSLDARSERVFLDPESGAESLDYLFDAFDIWLRLPTPPEGGNPVAALFERLFTLDRDDTEPVLLWQNDVQLFERACHTYGDMDGRRRVFPLGQTLFLHAVMTHLREMTEDPRGQLRVLRNLVEASNNEIRAENMGHLLREAESVMRGDDLDSIRTFNRRQVQEEIRKRAAVAHSPDLASVVLALENDDLLRGSLVAFDLDESLPRRGLAYLRAVADPGRWKAATAALLTFGDYFRPLRNYQRRFGFGTAHPANATVWRGVFTDATYDGMAPTREALTALLDHVASMPDLPADTILKERVDEWLRRREAALHFDWRYYLVRYDVMRDGASGIYVSDTDAMSTQLRMLTRSQLNSYYRDPILTALRSAAPALAEHREEWFLGNDPVRRMRLPKLGAELRNAADSLVLAPLELGGVQPSFAGACESHERLVRDGEEWRLPIRQGEIDGQMVDQEDRVALGAEVLVHLLA